MACCDAVPQRMVGLSNEAVACIYIVIKLETGGPDCGCGGGMEAKGAPKRHPE